MGTKTYPHYYRRLAASYYSSTNQNPPANYWTTYGLTDSVTSDGPVPDFRRKIATHQNATTNLSGVRYKWNLGTNDGHFVGKFKKKIDGSITNDYAWFNYGINAVPGDPSLDLKREAENQAATKFYKKLEQARTLFQGGTALAELGQTLSMIRSPLKGLRRGLDDYLSDIKRYRKGSPASKQKALADTWLEYAFGWTPLINDIEDGLSYLDRRKKQLENETIHLSATGRSSGTSIVPMSGVSVLTNYGCLKVTKYDVSVRYLGAIWSERASQTIATPESLGLGLRNFLPTVWEIIPYSFLVDYFTNVGDVISAYSLRNTKLAWACRTERWTSTLKATQTYRVPSTNNWDTLSWSDRLPSGDTSKITVIRSKVTSVPVPNLSFEVPGLGTKWLNLAALAASKRRLTPF